MKHLIVRSACVVSAGALVTGHMLFPSPDAVCCLARRRPLAVSWSLRMTELGGRLLPASAERRGEPRRRRERQQVA